MMVRLTGVKLIAVAIAVAMNSMRALWWEVLGVYVKMTLWNRVLSQIREVLSFFFEI